MLSDHEKSQIRNLIQDPRWGVIQKIADEYITHIRDSSVVRESEFETLRAAISQEAKTEGIKGFIQEVFKQVS